MFYKLNTLNLYQNQPIFACDELCSMEATQRIQKAFPWNVLMVLGHFFCSCTKIIAYPFETHGNSDLQLEMQLFLPLHCLIE